MIILSHRGYWLKADEKNSRMAFERSFAMGFGVETDLRDIAGKIVIAHDMPRGDEMSFEALLKLMDGRNLPLALNIKADGMCNVIKKLLAKYRHSNYFTFDMSIPEMVIQAQAGLNFFTGLSDIMPTPVLLRESCGVWVDGFHADWYTPQIIDDLITAGKKAALVSAELHRRAPEKQWAVIKQCKSLQSSDLMFCTDNPAQAEEYFNGTN